MWGAGTSLPSTCPLTPCKPQRGPTPAGSPPTEGGRPGPRGAQVRVLRPPAVGGRVDVEELGRVAVQLQLLALAHGLVFQFIWGRNRTGRRQLRGAPPEGAPGSQAPTLGANCATLTESPPRPWARRSDDTEDGPETRGGHARDGQAPFSPFRIFFQLCI